MSVETNKETARRFVEEVFNQNPSQGVQEFAAQDYTNYDPTGKATQGAAQNIAGFRAAFPDVHMTITQMLGEGDLVAVQWNASGTHQQSIAHLAPEFALPASGKSASVTGISLFRFSGDKIEEVWNHWDTHHLLGQLSAS
ncbi:MAG TPA: ester cyclase [Ktedonobacteraceae bacterium]|nr:ester cyclase [Ktedonobacteraceae bacterium]